jgi:aminoglycoside phosphotransferase (APT) family kinase protein
MGFRFGPPRVSGFELFRDGHPLAAELAPLLERVAADPVLRGAAPAGGPRPAIRRELRAGPGEDGAPTIERFRWCVQWRDPGPAGRFHARTLLYEPKRGEPVTFDFPADPRLRAGAAADSPLAAPGVAVLRYIPLRRITFRTGDVVGKMKRPSSLARAYARLAVAFAAARQADLAVPEPRGLDTAHGAYYQAAVGGRPLADVLAPGNAERLLRALGAVQREVHELPVEGLPDRGPEVLVRGAADDAAWIAFAVPGHAVALDQLARRMAVAAEEVAAGAERCFCHGDPAIDQVLLDGDTLAVVDFDDAAAGDPYADLGALLAALPHDAPQLFASPALGTRAVGAFLDGYRARSGRPIDERRLRAHRSRAELGLLASRVRKSRAGAGEVAATIDRLSAALERR